MKQKHAEPPEQNVPKADSPVQRGDFWISVLVLLFVVEFFLSIVALCYGIVVTPPRGDGEAARIAFPWIGWFAAMLAAPALILGLVRLLAGGQNPARTRLEAAWANRLPARALGVYRLIRGAPLFVVCVSLLALATTLLTIDSAFSLIRGIALALVPYAPHFIGCVTVFAIAIAALMAWFRYKNNQLAAEYQFRRDVLEKTGVILVDGRGEALLPADGWTRSRSADCPDAAPDAPERLKALPGPRNPRDEETGRTG